MSSHFFLCSQIDFFCRLLALFCLFLLLGFFVQFGIASPIYNLALAIYYLLVVRYRWTEGRLKGNAEKVFHCVPLLFAASTSFTSLGMGMYNNANLVSQRNMCWRILYAAK
jgi:hypothetical protein